MRDACDRSILSVICHHKYLKLPPVSFCVDNVVPFLFIDLKRSPTPLVLSSYIIYSLTK